MNNLKKRITVIALAMVMSLCNFLSVKAEHDDGNLIEYYRVVDEINQKYNAQITMPSENQLKDAGILEISVKGFKI